MKTKMKKVVLGLVTATLIMGSSITVFADELHQTNISFAEYEYDLYPLEMEDGAVLRKADGVTETFQYDSFGNITCVATQSGSYVSYKYYEYDESNRLIKKASDKESFTEYQYAGNTVNVIYHGEDGNTRLSLVYTFDVDGKLLQRADVNIYRPSTTDFQYDANNNLVAIITDSGADNYSFQYDSQNRLVEVRSGSNIVSYKYNSANQIIEEMNYSIEYNRINSKSNYTYDAYGKVLTEKGFVDDYLVPDGGRVDITSDFINEYDASGRLLKVTRVKNYMGDGSNSTYSDVEVEYAY